MTLRKLSAGCVNQRYQAILTPGCVYFLIVGEATPTLSPGCVTANLALWCGACLNCFVLVINRLLDVSNKAWMYMLFKDRRTYVVLLLPFLYTLYFCFFTPPILFNTNHMAWFFFTFAGGRKPEEEASFTIAFRSVLAFLKTTLLQLPTYRQQLVSCGSNMSTVCSVLKSFSASIES
ncbi:hypothetical protein Y032_0026g1395 [Ancylostoma ceylanicum]|uniref:7TM GPCR serpentine receptor class x (Srx) domain-containing protein n=1 Tax=Ancylostoma ceylanicum TaxID=53326 RepID=A0A016UTR8_9BILA|nr:hypothetical protein Y032_0026g1395 [Ancylostoma ceylanicum]